MWLKNNYEISAKPEITAKELAEIVGISQRKIEENLSKLKKMNMLERIGPDRCRY